MKAHQMFAAFAATRAEIGRHLLPIKNTVAQTAGADS
jgi:hypothetical protein